MAIYEPLLDPTQGSGIHSDEYAPAFDKELADGGYPGDTDGEPLLGDEPVKARMRFTVFNLGNTIMGGGILSLPYAFKLTGLATGITLLVIMCLLSVFSLNLLVNVSEYAGVGARTSYRDLATMSMGTFGRVWTDVCMIVACFGVMCSYMVINADMLTSLMAAWFGIDGEGAARTYILCGMLGILVPLASVRHLNALRFGSTIAVAAVLFVVIAIITQSAIAMSQGSLANCGQLIPEEPMSVPMAVTESGFDAPAYVLRELNDTDPEPSPTPTNSTPADPPEPPTWPGCVVAFNWTMDIFEAIPIIGFAYTCQMAFFAAYSELASPSKRRIGKVIWRALLICMALYQTAALFGYLQFRDHTASNVLNNYPDDDLFIQFVRIAVAIEITLGFPMSAHPCINTLDAVLFGNRPFSWKRKIPETLAMCGLALLVAILVPNVSDIFSLTGALASTPICFILPVLFLFKLSPNRGLKNLENAAALALFLIGLIIMVVSTVISVQNLIV